MRLIRPQQDLAHGPSVLAELDRVRTYILARERARTSNRRVFFMRALVYWVCLSFERVILCLTKLSSHLPLLFIGMENIMLSNHAQADEALGAAALICDGDPLLANERGVMRFNHGEYVSMAYYLYLLLKENTKLFRRGPLLRGSDQSRTGCSGLSVSLVDYILESRNVLSQIGALGRSQSFVLEGS
jgi:hypothetical protein